MDKEAQLLLALLLGLAAMTMASGVASYLSCPKSVPASAMHEQK